VLIAIPETRRATTKTMDVVPPPSVVRQVEKNDHIWSMPCENLHQDWQAPASRWPLAPRTTQAARRQQSAQAGAGAASKKSMLVKAKMCHIIM
jgi:hypothetical protein